MINQKISRIICALVVLLLCLTSCGGKEKNTNLEEDDTEEPDPIFYNLQLTVELHENLIFDKYDVDIYIDEEKIETLSQGDTYNKTINLEEGMHELWFYKAEDQSVSAKRSISMDDDRIYSCMIQTHKEDIEIDDEQYETLTEIKEREEAEAERKREEEERKAAEEEQLAIQTQFEEELNNCVRSTVDVGKNIAEGREYEVSLVNLKEKDITDKYITMDKEVSTTYRIYKVQNIDHENKTVQLMIAPVQGLIAKEKKKYKGMKKEPLNNVCKIAEDGGYEVQVKNRKGKRVDNKEDFKRKDYAFMSVNKVNYDKAKIVFNADTKKHLAELEAEARRKRKEAEEKESDRVPTRRPKGELTKEEFLNEEVIITPTGNCYHVDGCRTLGKTWRWIKRKDARNMGYTRCSKCHPDAGHLGW